MKTTADTILKVFKFFADGSYYAYAGESEDVAREQFIEEIGLEPDDTQEIPESEWDEPIITMYEDNDKSTEPWKMSIREAIVGRYPQMVFTNDHAFC